MSNYLNLSIKEINEKLKMKEIKPIDLVLECFDRIEKNSDLNAYITLNKEAAIKKAYELETKEVDNLLFALPIAIKDNIVTKNLKTTCASKMLENFIPVYDADVVERINAHNMIIIGKTNMDEFAMGSTSRTSYFNSPKNPWDKTKIAGGSSGGSAATIASRCVSFALGSDTGGSIRQPASYCGIVGMKPTYGRISRYGLIAFASSLDQIGPMTKNVLDNAHLLNILSGYDERDLTSVNVPCEDYTRFIGQDIKGMKFAVPNFFVSDIVDFEIVDKFNEIVKLIEQNGATVEYIDIDFIEHAVTLYQIIAMGEASSNLARFDGIRYGYSYSSPENLEDLYCKSRAFGFGEEVKRRIMVGSYLLSGKNATIYYDKALKIRDDMKKSFDKAFEKYDFIIGPTTTTVAYSLDKKTDASKSFADDILVIPVNMAGLPGMSIPIGFNKDNMPIGMQIIGARFCEAKMYQAAAFLEEKLNLDCIPKGVK